MNVFTGLQRCAFLLLAWAALAAGARAADPPTARDADAFRSVIAGQLDAFAADDAEGAFAFASPAIRAAFGTARNFVAMVRKAYPVVYRPVSVSFVEILDIEGVPVQVVEMSDEEGQVWHAGYRMERQADGTWRISGCVLNKVRAKRA